MITAYRFCAVFLCVLVSGCSDGQRQPTTRSVLTYFSNTSNYAGFLETGYTEAKDIYQNYPKYPAITVFWTINGVAASTAIPGPGCYHVFWSAAAERLVCITMRGVATIDPQNKAVVDLWRKEALTPRYAIDMKGKYVVLTGYDLEKKGATFVSVVGLTDKSQSIYYLINASDSVSGMAFIDAASAVASLFKGGPVKMQIVANEGWTFREASLEAKGAIIGAIEKKSVYQNENRVSWGHHSVAFPDAVLYVFVVNDRVFGLTWSGNLYRTTAVWELEKVGSFTPDDIIGVGALADALWVALKSGKVHVFNRNEQVFDIAIP